jgi:hypothetical protein
MVHIKYTCMILHWSYVHLVFPFLFPWVNFLNSWYTCLQWGIAYCVKGGTDKERKAMQVQCIFPVCFAVQKKEKRNYIFRLDFHPFFFLISVLGEKRVRVWPEDICWLLQGITPYSFLWSISLKYPLPFQTLIFPCWSVRKEILWNQL